MCERAFNLMCERAVSREISDGTMLSDKQTIQNWIAESRAEINAARLMVQDAAKKIDSQGTYNSRAEISIIKFYCANVLQKVVDYAIQVHGALELLMTLFYHLITDMKELQEYMTVQTKFIKADWLGLY